MQNSDDAIIVVSLNGQILSWNLGAEHIYGYAEEEVIGGPMSILVARDREHEILLLLERIERGEVIGHFDTVRVCKDGSLRRISETMSPVRDSSGNIIGASSSARDITAPKRVEEALRGSRDRYRALVDTITHGIEEIDTSGVITFANAAHHMQYEYSEGELIGISIFDIVATDSEADELREFLEYLVKEQPSPSPYLGRKRTKSGKIIDVEVAWTYTRDAEERVTGFISIITDISQRKRAEEALRESEERYRSITDDVLDSSAVGIFILDSAFRVVWVNRSLERYFGIRRDELVGKDKRQLIRQRIKDTFEDPEGFAGKVLATYDDNTYVENFECHVLPTGEREERWLEHWSQPIGSGLYAGGRIEHYTDLTARKRAEVALQNAREELESKVELLMQKGNPFGLTFRELTVIQMVSAGRSDKNIGTFLGISFRTVEKHVERILNKMGASTRTEASVRALRQGLID